MHKAGGWRVRKSSLTIYTHANSEHAIGILDLGLSSTKCTNYSKEPSTLTLYFSKTPAWYNFTAQFKAVCPPKAAKMPSGFSRSMTLTTNSGVTGRKYTPVSHSRRCLNCGNVGVDQNRHHASFLECLDSLTSRIVKFPCLSNGQSARAQH